MTRKVCGPEDDAVKAVEVFNGWHGWRYGVDLRTSQPFFIIDGSEPGDSWYAAANDCTCPDRRYRRHVCKHMAAVRLWCGALLDGRVDSRVISLGERRALFAQMAQRFDLDTAERADSLLEAYEQQQAARAEALVDDDVAVEGLDGVDWVDQWPDQPADDGRPVWLEAGDSWGPDTAAPAEPPGLVAPPPPPRRRARAGGAGLSQPADPRDLARHHRQRRRPSRLVAPPAGLLPAPRVPYAELFPPDA